MGRLVEIAVRDGAPALAVEVIDMSTGRKIGALKKLSLIIDAEADSDRTFAEMSYLKLEGSPDGTVSPDRRDPIVLSVDESGEPERVTETVEVSRFVTATAFRKAQPSV